MAARDRSPRAALAACLAGCGGGDDDGGGDEDAGERRAGHDHASGTARTRSAGKAIKELVDKFNASHPKITVDAQIGAPRRRAAAEDHRRRWPAASTPTSSYHFGPNVANLARSPKAVDLTEAVKDAGLELGRTSTRPRATR